MAPVEDGAWPTRGLERTLPSFLPSKPPSFHPPRVAEGVGTDRVGGLRVRRRRVAGELLADRSRVAQLGGSLVADKGKCNGLLNKKDA